MFDCSSKILIGVVTGTLLSAMTTVTVAVEDTHHLLDSQGNPIKTQRIDECVETPQTPNTPSRLYKECGDIIDRDGDGIYDDEDVCPDNTPEELVRGVHQSGPRKGCPMDSDNDGVPDYRSDCPNNTPLEISKGVDSRGCPLDTDQDGVPDYRDSCPGTPFGLAVDEDGCAIIDTPKEPLILSGDVLFKFDRSDLTQQAKGQLDELLNQSGIDLIESIKVVGHTDTIGKKSYNQKLSEERAASVANYLISIGIAASQMIHSGEGELNPIASNDTKIGRAQNRRVEITISKYRKK
jgi:OOP family OmpA-OmpF porin